MQSVQDQKPFIAVGVNGQLTVTPTEIRISHKGFLGFLTQGLKGEKGIDINTITSIQMKKAGRMFNGYIQFAFLGGHETKEGIFGATHDENTIMFKLDQQETFDRAKALIEQYKDQYEATLRNQSSSSPASSAADEIEKFAALRDRGIISNDEFEAKKAVLLTR